MATVSIGLVNAFIGEAASTGTDLSDIWLGDSGATNHIKSTSENMVDVEDCPPGTKIRQVQGTVDVRQWGTVLLQVDAAEGKKIIRLTECLIVPQISVNLFSMQRVLDLGYLLIMELSPGSASSTSEQPRGLLSSHRQ